MSNGKYDNFMRKKISNSEFTNTRIGNPSKNIYGKYLIKEDDYETFLNNYYNHVFENHNKEYLTEKQLIENGPILLDIDLRYNYGDTRQHTKEHIIDFLMEYMSQYSKIVGLSITQI